MNSYLVAVRSITYAQKLSAVFAAGGIRASVVKAPKNISQRGCGYAVSAYGGIEDIRASVERAQLVKYKVYRRDDGGEYAEVLS